MQHDALHKREQKIDSQEKVTNDEDGIKNKRLVEHLFKDSKCSAKYEETQVLYSHPSKLLREVVEAYYIERGKEDIISEASISITRQERRLLQRRL